MTIRRSLLSLHLLVVALFVMAAPVRAQWVVYDFRTHALPEVSENFVPYSGLYVIAPVTGGNASMIFITEEGGRFYNVAENGARYFTAASPTGRLAVVSALAQTGTARVMYQAVGMLNSSISYTVRGEHLGGRVSTDMLGTLLASDDESLAVAPAADGSIGMVGSAQLTGTLRLDLSRILNHSELPMSQAVATVTDLLEKYGYQLDSPDHTQAAASSAPQGAAGEPEPQPATPEQSSPDTSLFPPGSREELEQSLNPPEAN